MLCPTCQNMLQKMTDSNKLRYSCWSCGSEFEATGIDTLIYVDEKKKYSLTKDGRTIWHYPANQRVHKRCESPTKCNETIVAWENDDTDMNIIYGCRCGYSWKDVVQVSS